MPKNWNSAAKENKALRTKTLQLVANRKHKLKTDLKLLLINTILLIHYLTYLDGDGCSNWLWDGYRVLVSPEHSITLSLLDPNSIVCPSQVMWTTQCIQYERATCALIWFIVRKSCTNSLISHTHLILWNSSNKTSRWLEMKSGAVLSKHNTDVYYHDTSLEAFMFIHASPLSTQMEWAGGASTSMVCSWEWESHLAIGGMTIAFTGRTVVALVILHWLICHYSEGRFW